MPRSLSTGLYTLPVENPGNALQLSDGLNGGIAKFAVRHPTISRVTASPRGFNPTAWVLLECLLC